MTDSRRELNEQFVSILGSRNVYFQPPETLKMKYPCIRYSIENIERTEADNEMYLRHDGYSVTLIDSNPESQFVDEILKIPYCSFNRFYTSDNLNHWVFNINKNHY